MWNLDDANQRTKYFKLKNQIFLSSCRKTKLFDRKTWFFDQVPGDNVFLLPTLI